MSKRMLRSDRIFRTDADDSAAEQMAAHLNRNHVGNARRDPRLERSSYVGPPVDNLDPETRMILKQEKRIHEVVDLKGIRREGVLRNRDLIEASMGFIIDPPKRGVTLEA